MPEIQLTPSDRLAPFWPLIPGIRWGTLTVGFVIVAIRQDYDASVLIWGSVLLAYAIWRTFRPLHYYDGKLWSIVAVLAEVALNVWAVVGTGYWSSPFIFCLLTSVMAAGFARGFAFAVRTALAVALCVAIPHFVLTRNSTTYDNIDTAQWTVELLLVALVAGYASRLFGEVEARRTLAVDRMSRLAEANALLFSLHRVAQTLPASLDLDDVVVSTISRLRDLIDFDTAVLLLRDEATSSWILAQAEGVRPERTLRDADLPPPLRAAAGDGGSILIADLFAGEGPGLGQFSRSGLYSPLHARDTLVGLIALEHQEPDHFGRRELGLFDGFVEPAALAIDNARWFSRLRTMGAEEERSRIARDIHDRIGQALAYLAFELDRIAKRSRVAPVHDDLEQLRTDVRTVVSEVRETLYDLRTDVTDQHDMAETLDEFLKRVAERADLEVTFRHSSTGRLPLVMERELWRIAQEAITNVERHANAAHLTVRWECDGHTAELTIADDGSGFVSEYAGRTDSYGLTGMRERADAVGARIDIDSAPEQGTTVRCRLEAPT
jgi:signal transduction histidine kinase